MLIERLLLSIILEVTQLEHGLLLYYSFELLRSCLLRDRALAQELLPFGLRNFLNRH